MEERVKRTRMDLHAYPVHSCADNKRKAQGVKRRKTQEHAEHEQHQHGMHPNA